MAQKHQKRVIFMEIIKFNDFLSGNYKTCAVEGITQKESDAFDIFKGLCILSLVLIFAPTLIKTVASVTAYHILPSMGL